MLQPRLRYRPAKVLAFAGRYRAPGWPQPEQRGRRRARQREYQPAKVRTFAGWYESVIHAFRPVRPQAITLYATPSAWWHATLWPPTSRQAGRSAVQTSVA